MSVFFSLKYRIAATIFVLEFILFLTVLGQTQSTAFHHSQKQIDAQDEIIMSLLSEASTNALFISEYTPLQPLFQRATEIPHIRLIVLLDYRDIIVASSDPSLFGKTIDELPRNEDEYWRDLVLEGFSGQVGHVFIKFSLAELQQARQETTTLGLIIGVVGMTVIAVVGIVMGHLLTRRLQILRDHTQILADGDFTHEVHVRGNDEIGQLAESLNSMTLQLDKSFQHVQHMAYHDALTGLVNRLEFNARLSHALHDARVHKDPHILMMLDLDQFKIVNDTCGHNAGDEMLKKVARLLHNSLRGQDTLARLGGDEFGVLLESCSIEDAITVAEKLVDNMQDFRFVWNQQTFRVGVSIGMVPIEPNSPDINELMSIADMACYTAKARGGNTFQINLADDVELQERTEEMRWVNRLAEAIENDDWVLYLQPILALQPHDHCHFGEFLLRMKQGDEVISPAQFLAAAERYRLMTRIDRQVASMAFKHLANMPLDLRPDVIFINLSGLTVGDASFLEWVKKLTKEHQLEATRICFEITETVAISHIESAIEFIHELKSMGFQFALDDFGSGMSNFQYLKKMPVDYIKIDGSFVLNMTESEVDHSIISSIHRIAHQSGAKTIAEFVETKAQLEALARIGIDYAQGYSIGRPQPLAHYLEDKNSYL